MLYNTLLILGVGSFGTVYKAKQILPFNRLVAIKRIAIRKITSWLEPCIMQTFQHKHIQGSLDVFTTRKHLNIVSELALQDLQEDWTADHATRITWCYQIASAVAALHKFGIVHCDIKPGNVLLFSDNTVRLTDFSLSVKLWSQNQKYSHSTGTASYAALESFENQIWDTSLDIWSLACTFYYILTGQQLFKHQDTVIDYIKQLRAPINLKLVTDPLARDLLQSMLVSAAERPDINTILGHELFKDYKNVNYMVRQALTDNNISTSGLVDLFTGSNTNRFLLASQATNYYRAAITLGYPTETSLRLAEHLVANIVLDQETNKSELELDLIKYLDYLLLSF